MKRTRKKKLSSLLSSGSTMFDLALGGGYPFGKMVNIVGDKSTGKTLLASECIAKLKHQYPNLKWVYDDAEAGYSFDTSSIYGFDICPDGTEASETIEDFEYNVSKALDDLEPDQPMIYVLDSMDSLTSNAEIKRQQERHKAKSSGKEITGGTYGLEKQKALGEFFRLKRKELKDKKCLLIIISQVRENIGITFGSKFTRTGGKALDFYAAQIIWLAEIEKIKKKDTPIGITIKARVSKNKIGPPFRSIYTDILFGYGVDDIGSCLDFIYDLRTPQGKGRQGKIDYDGKQWTRNKLIPYIESEGHEQVIQQMAIDKWVEFERSISCEERKNKYS